MVSSSRALACAHHGESGQCERGIMRDRCARPRLKLGQGAQVAGEHGFRDLADGVI